MKLFRRNKTAPPRDELAAALDANPGVWFDLPDGWRVFGREHFLVLDFQGDPATGRVQIRRKPLSS